LWSKLGSDPLVFPVLVFGEIDELVVGDVILSSFVLEVKFSIETGRGSSLESLSSIALTKIQVFS
jgi:hypothetical protein